MKINFKTILSTLCVTLVGFSYSGLAQQSLNSALLYHWSDESLPASFAHNNTYNEIWGYEADGKEYAIIGTTMGTHIFDLTDGQEEEIHFIEGAITGGQIVHRDYHDYANHLYIVCDEGASTLQIVDLSGLPESVSVVYDSSDLILRAHNIFIDEDSGLMYRCGGNDQFSVFSLEDPASPTLVIDCDEEVENWGSTVGYVHDVFVRDGIAYCNAADALYIVDFTVPTSPVTLGSLEEYEDSGYNHSGWLHENGTIYALADETHGKRVKILDVSDPTDIQVLSLIGSDVHEWSIPHNLIFDGDLLHVAYYVDGYYVWDLSDPANPSLYAYYDTSEVAHSLG
ncbi:MAG: choice-of-anchor B family protein, partial [Flavobacteriales bacterium]|nr:choice-of-anchor B family protein [Flavobacteriales bacterium]